MREASLLSSRQMNTNFCFVLVVVDVVVDVVVQVVKIKCSKRAMALRQNTFFNI